MPDLPKAQQPISGILFVIAVVAAVLAVLEVEFKVLDVVECPKLLAEVDLADRQLDDVVVADGVFDREPLDHD